MPIYAFECSSCGHDFDRLQKLSDPDPAECPQCGKPEVRRQLTAPAFRLAGSGWYETDFKKDGDRKRNLAKSDESGGKSEGKSEGKGDGKPDSKPASDAGSAKPAEPKASTAA